MDKTSSYVQRKETPMLDAVLTVICLISVIALVFVCLPNIDNDERLTEDDDLDMQTNGTYFGVTSVHLPPRDPARFYEE